MQILVESRKTAYLLINIDTNFQIKNKEKMKDLSPGDFLSFFKWLIGNKRIRVGKVSLTAHSQLTPGKDFMYPPLIDSDEKEPISLVGLRFRSNKDFGIDTVIIERTKNKKAPLYFMLETFPKFTFDKKLFNEKFFNSPMIFVANVMQIFCNKKMLF